MNASQNQVTTVGVSQDEKVQRARPPDLQCEGILHFQNAFEASLL